MVFRGSFFSIWLLIFMKIVEMQLFLESVSPLSNSSEIVQFIWKWLKTYSTPTMAQRKLLNHLGFHGRQAEVKQRKIHDKRSALELRGKEASSDLQVELSASDVLICVSHISLYFKCTVQFTNGFQHWHFISFLETCYHSC